MSPWIEFDYAAAAAALKGRFVEALIASPKFPDITVAGDLKAHVKKRGEYGTLAGRLLWNCDAVVRLSKRIVKVVKRVGGDPDKYGDVLLANHKTFERAVREFVADCKMFGLDVA